MCRLGGYENTLLGYRFRVCEEWSEVDSEDLDVIMFGELSTIVETFILYLYSDHKSRDINHKSCDIDHRSCDL